MNQDQFHTRLYMLGFFLDESSDWWRAVDLGVVWYRHKTKEILIAKPRIGTANVVGGIWNGKRFVHALHNDNSSRKSCIETVTQLIEEEI